MTVPNTGKRGRPRKPDLSDPAFAPLLAEIETAEALVLESIRTHERDPSQAATVRLLETQARVASLRALFARKLGDGNAAQHETELVVKLARARDDAVGKLWGDELRSLHARATEREAVRVALAGEIDAEEEEIP